MSKKKTKQPRKGRRVADASLETVLSIVGDAPYARDRLIEYLHQIQDQCGQLHIDNLAALAELIKVPQVEVYEVASFYHHFDIVMDGEKDIPATTVRVCDSVSCEMAGARQLLEGLQSSAGDNLRVQAVPCVGRCQHAPVAVVGWNPIHEATLENVQQSLANNATEAEALPDLVNFAAYREGDGYALYQRCLLGDVSRESVIETLEEANLRGLGGAGFPAGRKWRILSDMPAPRLVAINIDEGEPGTFKDREFLEKDPHRMLEGILIACWVIDSSSVYIYLRDEYAAIRRDLTQAVVDLQNSGLFSDLPAIEIRRGAGAYICGEESAMIESIEGKRGLPRQRPPYIAEVGLFDRPTLEHNAETLYWIRDLVEKGGAWFSGEGRHGRSGLRAYSLSGRVQKPGVHLAPAGITISELIAEYGGGMLQGHEFYGYLPGGASGGILPASMADIPLDFDTLQPHGCFIGSAAVMVLSDHDKAKDVALNVMNFFKHESCGQCTPCRVGTAKAVDLMAAAKWDTDSLNDLATVMEDASICGLGQAAPNAIRCVMNHFPQELEQ